MRSMSAASKSWPTTPRISYSRKIWGFIILSPRHVSWRYGAAYHRGKTVWTCAPMPNFYFALKARYGEPCVSPLRLRLGFFLRQCLQTIEDVCGFSRRVAELLGVAGGHEKALQ